MAKFLPQNKVRLFAPEQRGTDLYIYHVGYDDFADPTLSPIYHLRMYTSCTLHIVLGGKGYLHVGGKMHHITDTCLFFLPPKTPMAYYPDENDPWEYLYFCFDGTQAAELGKHMGFSPEQPILHSAAFSAIRRVMEQLFRTLQDENDDAYYLALSAFYEIVHLCCRKPHPKGAASARYMIDTNYASQDFTVEQLCRDLHISHSHLCRVFKETYGISVIRYLIDRRLEQARQLLEETELSVKAIAYSCGFSDELHFMKSFKASTGMTAREYRRKTPNHTP